MVELMAGLALGLDAFWPMYDCTVARSAPMRRDLLGPLVRSVHRVRPADGVMIIRVGAAQPVQTNAQECRGLQRAEPVERNHFVESALQRAFPRSSVVADDEEDEGIVEHLQLGQRV